MANQKLNDPYVYPNSHVLINKYDIRDADSLQEIEGVLFALKNAEPLPAGNFGYTHLKAIHHHYFNELYDWAGKERTIDISKQNSYFAHAQYINKELTKIFSKLQTEDHLNNLGFDDFCKKLSYYFNEINAAHPFREGNGRTLRAFFDKLSENAGFQLDWSRVTIDEYTQANIKGFDGDYKAMEEIFLTIASPIKLSKHINAIEDIPSKDIKNEILNYIELQQSISDLIKQKNAAFAKKVENIESINVEIKAIDKKVIKIATSLINNAEVKSLIKENAAIFSSLSKQGGFNGIQQRFISGQHSLKDCLAVLRHAQNNVLTLSNTLNRKTKR